MRNLRVDRNDEKLQASYNSEDGTYEFLLKAQLRVFVDGKQGGEMI